MPPLHPWRGAHHPRHPLQRAPTGGRSPRARGALERGVQAPEGRDRRGRFREAGAREAVRARDRPERRRRRAERRRPQAAGRVRHRHPLGGRGRVRQPGRPVGTAQPARRGSVHANAMGFTDIYSFTKAMAEHAVVELHGDVPLSIVRPSIIESAFAEPFPGWLEGFRMAEPLILAFGRNILRDFSGLPDALLDIIPADFVVNTVLAVAANPPPDDKPKIYHAASGSRNPLRFRQMTEQASEYYTANPLRDRYGQAIGTPSWTFPTRSELATRARTALRLTEAAQWIVERLPLGASVSELSDDRNEARERLDRGLNLIQLYGVYTEVDCIFDTRNVTALWEKTPAAERAVFPFDPALYDWSDYFQRGHFPTLVRMTRTKTPSRKGRQPTGSTAPRAEPSSVRSLIERRTGRSDVLAVFDVDGTLVETNVVEYFFWMRLRAQPLDDWPAFMAQMAREAPRWLYLERRSRAEFQRSFYREYDGLDYEIMRRLGREALNAVTLRRIYPEGMRRIREHKRAGHRVLLLTGALAGVVQPLAALR